MQAAKRVVRNALAVKPMHRVRMNGQTVSRLKRLLASATRRPPIRCELQLLCTGARLLEQSIAIMERRRTPRTSKTERRNGHEHIAPTLRLSRKPCKKHEKPEVLCCTTFLHERTERLRNATRQGVCMHAETDSAQGCLDRWNQDEAYHRQEMAATCHTVTDME